MTATWHREVDSPGHSRSIRLAALLFGLALIPRVILALVFLDTPIGLDDMHQYDMLGRSLAAGHGYRWYGRQDVELLRPLLEGVYGLDLPDQIPEHGFETAFRPPGYPFFLSLIYRAAGFDARLPAARLAQAALGATLPVLSYLVARRLGLRARTALVGGLAVAFYPFLWFLPAGLATENLFLPLSMLAILILLEHSHDGRARLALLAGLTLGAAALTRGVMLAATPIAAWWLYRRSNRPRVGLLVFAGMFLLVTGPWAVRNSIVLGRPAFADGSLSYNLFVGYHPQGDGGFDIEQAVLPLQYLDDAPRDRWTMEQAVSFITNDPLQIPTRITQRWVYFWGFEDRELIYFYSNGFFGPLPEPLLILAYAFLVLPFPVVLLSAAFGITRVPAERPWIMAMMASLSVPYLLIMATARFHLPLVPLLGMYAAATWTRNRPAVRPSRPALVLAALFAASVVIAWGFDLSTSWPTLQQVAAPGGHLLGLDY